MGRSQPLKRELVRERSETGTDGRILESAIALFAERGFDQVTVREIADHAGANPAAISYYFGAKEQLIKQVMRSVIAPLNKERLAALAALEARGGKSKVEDVVRAMVEPTVGACKNDSGPQRHYARILVLSFALRQPFVDEVMSEQTDEVALKFVKAFSAALPGTDAREIYWRFDFMVGSMIHILLDSSRNDRIKQLSGGLCDTSSADAIIDQLVAFIAGGFKAPV
jgi:AcrR family transcriptional regulator